MKSAHRPFIFIQKTLFFPKQGILVIGDLHIGYDSMLKNQGINIGIDQIEETKKELEAIFQRVRTLYTLKKIVLIGDIKHHFAFEKSELFDLRNFLRFLEKFLSKESIILIKGNHDTFTLKDYELKDSWISDDKTLAFTHGDKTYPELFKDKQVKSIIIGHIHPAVLIKDKFNIKREKFKCFLVGKYKSKQVIILPSFFPLIQGTEINELEKFKTNPFQLIPKTQLKDFETFVVGKNRVYGFGKFG